MSLFFIQKERFQEAFKIWSLTSKACQHKKMLKLRGPLKLIKILKLYSSQKSLKQGAQDN